MKTALAYFSVLVMAFTVYAEPHNIETRNSPQVSLFRPGNYGRLDRTEEFLYLILDAGDLCWENRPIPRSELVPYVNGLLKANRQVYICVVVREGSRFGDLVSAIDILRSTNAEHVVISFKEIPYGKD